MSLVINTNEQATRIHGVYNRNNTQMNAAMTRVATAQKINSARDGASMWAISEKMRERIRANDQANQNVQNDTALLKTAQGGISNTLDILNTLKERAINAANDSNVSSDRQKIAEEVKQLVAQIDDNAAKVKFNGRQLLNGAGEGSATSAAGGASSATPVTASGNYGNSAVYGLTGLYEAIGTPISADSKTLTSLVGKNGEALFQEGDKITFSWTDNGVANEKSLTVTSSSKVSDLAAFGSAAYKTASTDSFTATDENGNTIKVPITGYYFEGTANHNISDFAISVTNSSGATNTAAQAAMQPTAIQQSYGDDKKGTNEVYYMTKITSGDDSTRFAKLGGLTYDADPSTSKDYEGATYTINVNGQSMNFTGNMTIAEINARMKEKGIKAELHVAAASSTLTYDGDKVSKGTYGAAVDYKTPSAGLYVVGTEGESIEYLSLKGNASNSALKTAFTIDTDAATDSSVSAFERSLSLDDTTASSSSSSSTLPQSDALQFYVGGEANFGINFTIGKATAQNLLGGTAESFSSLFNDKAGAEKAIGIIDNAINKTLTEQTRLGAMEARLGYTSDNLVTMNENLEASNSAIRDADIAREMTNYMKFAVLSQSSQYMLAQAGQNAYQVLNLLNA